MRAVNDDTTGLAHADTQLRVNGQAALRRMEALKANLATLAAAIQQLERKLDR
jgi:hypothetical protein